MLGKEIPREGKHSAETDTRSRVSSDVARWSSLLLANERIIFTSPILVRPPTAIHLPSFLLPAPKRRQLILTDFPRLITVKEEPNNGLSVKGECVFVVRGSARSAASGGALGGEEGESGLTASGSGGVANRVVDVQEKGPKGFVVQTASQLHSYTTDTPDLRKEWMTAIKRIMA